MRSRIIPKSILFIFASDVTKSAICKHSCDWPWPADSSRKGLSLNLDSSISELFFARRIDLTILSYTSLDHAEIVSKTEKFKILGKCSQIPLC